MQPASDYLQKKSPRRLAIAIATVVLLHLAILWVLQNGLDHKSFVVLKKTVEATLIDEIKPKLPPPPPPPHPEPAKAAKLPPPALPKATVPVPEVKPPPTAAPAITTTPEPAPVVPTPAPAPVPSPAPVQAAPPVAAVQSPPTQSTAPVKTGVKTSAKDVSGSCEPPDYPNISRRNEEEGTVVVAFTISEDGKVLGSKIKSTSGFSRLDEAARSAFSKCKFRPATSDGQPVQGEATVAYRFRLD